MLDVEELARSAKAASRVLAVLSTEVKDRALLAGAAALHRESAAILAANAQDLERGRAAGLSDGVLDRLALDRARVEAMADGLRQVAELPDPVGEVLRDEVLANGLRVRQRRVPLGVVAVVYEGRPNVTVDAAGLCLKSGNAVLLRGSSSARCSNATLVEILRSAVTEAGSPPDCIVGVPPDDHASVGRLLALRGLVDVAVPRGGAGLIASVVDQAKVPILETGVGNCHVFVDASADLAQAIEVIRNAKVSRPSVCNATETLLVHRSAAAGLLPPLLAALSSDGVTVHGDEEVLALWPSAELATDADWGEEYLSLDLAVRVVADVDEALAHIRRWSTGHTEAVLTRDADVAARFVAGVDSAAVMVNASTRFTDGEQLGYGAELGISTQKLHARGPLGLRELTSTALLIEGDGQVRW